MDRRASDHWATAPVRKRENRTIDIPRPRRGDFAAPPGPPDGTDTERTVRRRWRRNPGPLIAVAAAVAAAVVIAVTACAVRGGMPAAAPARVGAPAAGGLSRKGVGAWQSTGADRALALSRASWFYTWSTTPADIIPPAGVDFVPMVWGADDATPAALEQARRAGPYLLGFNEPDVAEQSNLTVEQALDLWPRLMATGLTLGSPAVATDAATPGGWLDRFMSGAAQRGYRVDFIAVHWYGADFVTADAVDQLRSYLSAVYDRYHLPIWLTEFALVDFPGGWRYPGPAEQAAFLTASTAMLAGLPYLQRYAWFALTTWASAPTTGLFSTGAELTAVGRAFQTAAS